MKTQEVLSRLRAVAPEHYACDWDNVGLLVDSSKKEIRRIYLSLDATDEVIAEARRLHADLLVTHHPLIFTGLKRVVEEDFIGRRIKSLIASDMAYYAMHTSFDVAVMADIAADRLGLKQQQVLEVLFTEGTKELGIGKVGTLEGCVTLDDCVSLVKERFGIPAVKVFGDLDTKINLVAISPGSGKSEILFALEKEASVLITGDIDHHDGIDAVARGLCIIDAGHYGLEHIFVPYMEHYLKENCDGVDIIKREKIFPFQIL